jgi:hypothetical protein
MTLLPEIPFGGNPYRVPPYEFYYSVGVHASPPTYTATNMPT